MATQTKTTPLVVITVTLILLAVCMVPMALYVKGYIGGSSADTRSGSQNYLADQPKPASLVECWNGATRMNIPAATHITSTPMQLDGNTVECASSKRTIAAFLVNGKTLSDEELSNAIIETLQVNAAR